VKFVRISNARQMQLSGDLRNYCNEVDLEIKSCDGLNKEYCPRTCDYSNGIKNKRD